MSDKHRMPDEAVLICGGEGTRLRPITYKTPKPLIDVQGRPILEYNLLELKRNGISRAVLAVGYKADVIKEHFKDGSQLGMQISYSTEQEPLGTGGAIKKALSVSGCDTRAVDVIAMMGDNLVSIDLARMYSLHAGDGALATLALKRADDVTGFGVVNVSGNVVTSFVEKPDPQRAESDLINIGVYVLSGEALRMLPSGEKFSIEKDFFQRVAGSGRMRAYVTRGQWFPADNMERYEKAKREWKGP